MRTDGKLTVKQAAGRLGVSPKTVNKWINAGHFPGAAKMNPLRPKSSYLIPVEDVERIEQAREEQRQQNVSVT